MIGAARQLQLVQLAKLAESRALIERTQHMYPEIESGAMSIYTNGEAPRYEATPAKNAPLTKGTRAILEIRKIIESMRGNITSIEALVCSGESLIYSERLGYIPNASAPESLHGRTFSVKSRTISDLRRINLGLNTDDSFAI